MTNNSLFESYLSPRSQYRRLKKIRREHFIALQHVVYRTFPRIPSGFAAQA